MNKGLCFVCQKCGQAVLEPHDDPEVAMRRAIEDNRLHTMHPCAGGLGLARLVGTADSFESAADQLAARVA